MTELATILYVDDEPINLMLFKILLGKKFNVLTANSGDAGLKVLNENKNIAGVVSDMRMPGMNGIEFIRLAKNNCPDIFYFILTGYDITAEISIALKEMLIHKYFRKPFNDLEMETAIKEALGK